MSSAHKPPPKKTTAHQQEAIRRTAVARVLQGEKPGDVMKDMGLNRSSIYKWLKRYKTEGEEGLAKHQVSGRAPKVDGQSIEQICTAISHRYPHEFGFNDALWSAETLAVLIQQEHAIKLGRSARDYLLQQLGLSNQRLTTQLSNLNAPGITPWLHQSYSNILQQSQKNRGTLYFLQSHKLNAHISVLSAVPPGGRPRFALYNHPLGSESIIGFIQKLITNTQLSLLIDRDSPIEKLLQQQQVRWFLGQHTQKITLHFLPGEGLPSAQEAAAAQQLGAGKLSTIEPPPQTDMGQWALLLNQSLLDDEQPLTSFLMVLTESLQGRAIIASDLKRPASLIRFSPADAPLDHLVKFNKITTETWHSNPLLPVLNKPGDIHTLDEVIPRSEWKQNPFCDYFLQAFSIEHMLGLCFAGPENSLCGLFVYWWTGRTFREKQSREFLLRLQPHLETGMALAIKQWRNRFSLRALEEATDHLEIAAVVLDGNGRVTEYSGAAERMLAKQQLKLVDKQLVFPASNNQADNQQKKFRQAVNNAIAWRQAPVFARPVETMRMTQPNGDWLGVLVQPITPPSLSVPHSAAVFPHVIVYISDPAKQSENTQHQLIVRLFQLSEREAYLTTLLTQGHPLNKAAKTMNITEATARTYLKNVYEKVGVKRQQDLVQRVMKSVAVLA